VAERSGQAESAPVTLGGARLPNARRGPVELGGLTLSEPPTLRVDSKGVVMQANAAAAAMVGATDPDRLGGVALRDLFTGQEPDLRLRRMDGSELPVRVVQTPIPNTGLHSIVLVDVSDLAAAAAELREERRRLTDVQHVAGIASWEFDPATGKTVWSDSHYEILGIERGSVEPGAQAVLDIVHPDDVEMVREYWSNHQFSGEPIDIEYRIVRPDGAVRWIRDRAFPVRDARGHVYRITGIATDVTEFDRDGLVYEKNGVRVIAFEVDHGDVIKPCYGYRFEYDGRVAVFSSDTRYNQNVIKYGAGADLLVHEVASARPELMKEAYIQRIIGHHTTPYDCGRVFAQTRPKLAAFTHVVQIASPQVPPPTLEELKAEVRRTYDGEFIVGEDLMSFEIGATVTVKRLMP